MRITSEMVWYRFRRRSGMVRNRSEAPLVYMVPLVHIVHR